MGLQTQAGGAEMYGTWTDEAKGRVKPVTPICSNHAGATAQLFFFFNFKMVGAGKHMPTFYLFSVTVLVTAVLTVLSCLCV